VLIQKESWAGVEDILFGLRPRRDKAPMYFIVIDSRLLTFKKANLTNLDDDH